MLVQSEKYRIEERERLYRKLQAKSDAHEKKVDEYYKLLSIFKKELMRQDIKVLHLRKYFNTLKTLEMRYTQKEINDASQELE